MTPDDALKLARSLLARGELAQAESFTRRIVQNLPNDPRALDLLGHIVMAKGDFTEAARIYEHAITLFPRVGALYHALAHACLQQRQFTRAESAFRRALELGTDNPKVHLGLGLIAYAAGNFADACEAFRRALVMDGNFADAHYHLGVTLGAQGEIDEGINNVRRAIELSPHAPEFWFGLGNLLNQQLDIDAALDAFRRALFLEPRLEEAACKVAELSWTAGRRSEAQDVLQKFVAANPNAFLARSRLLFLHTYSDADPEQTFREHLECGRRVEAAITPSQPRRASAARAKLRIGFLSANFYAHPTSQFLHPLFRALDRDRVEVFCYSISRRSDAFTDRFRALADRWVDLNAATDDQAAGVIGANEPDALIDLAGHTPDARLALLARKPAPLQITWLGYLGTSGLRAMDYRLTDPFMEVSSAARYFIEKPLLLPRTYWCYEPAADAPSVDHAPSRSGNPTFGALGNFLKLMPSVLETWAKILARVPNSRLILYARYPQSQDLVRSAFAAHGILADRVEFVPRQSMADYLRTYRHIDVALDPFPYGGGATTCDALWMGVPVVTLAGNAPHSRTGVSILSNVGVPELVATTIEQYIECALRALSAAPEYRRTLRQRMQSSPLMDARRFAADFTDTIARVVS